MKQCKLEAIHYEFQTDGTRYDLVLVDDPYGGIIVAWTSTGYLWRYYEGDYLKPLSNDYNPHDAKNIFDWLELNLATDQQGQLQSKPLLHKEQYKME